MKNTLYVKALAIAIAASFLVMAGNGLGRSEQSEEVLMADGSPEIMQAQNLDTSRINERLGDLPNLAPPIETPDSVIFDDSFEDDILGDVPDDPPWAVTEQTSTIYGGWGPDEFEDDIVGQNPDPPWETVDGATSTYYWQTTAPGWEDGTVGTAIPTAAYMGTDGYFGTFDGSTLQYQTPAAGAPSGSIFPGQTTGGVAAQFICTAGNNYFGPAGFGGDQTTHAYAGSWIRPTNAQRIDIIIVEGDTWATSIEVAFLNPGTGYQIYHWPGGTGTATGVTVSLNTWHELIIEYDEVTDLYTIWFDGAAVGANSAFNAPTDDVDGMLWFGGGSTINCQIDNWWHGIPPAGGAHAIDVSNAYSSSYYGGTQSVHMDQNNYAASPASATIHFPAPYAWGAYAGCSWSVMTDTVANTNGARFLFKDYNDRTLMAMRFSGGNIQYGTGATWTTIMPFTANTEYHFDLWMDAVPKTYSGLYVNESEFYDLTGIPLVNVGAGIATFQAIATVSTQSTIYFDHVTMWGEVQHGTVRVSDMYAHTGAQSVRMWEGNADTFCDMDAYLGGDLCTYGEFGFWFYGDGTLGGGTVYVLDTMANIVTVISIGGDPFGGPIPDPGQMKFIDGLGDLTGYLVDGPAITPNTWNNISIRYDTVAKTFEVRWNGALQGTYGFLQDAATDVGLVFFFGEGPAAPCDWFFDDISLWVDDLPATPQNLHTDFPPPIPSTEAWYTVNQDNGVEGAVTGTYANIDEISPLDGATENIQEITPPGGGIPVVQGWQSSGSATTSTNLVLTAPAGIQVGELLLLIVENDANTAAPEFNTVTGWTKINEAGSATPDAFIGAYWRVATGTEGTVTVTSNHARAWQGWYIRISGANPTAPINVQNFAESTAAGVNPHVIPQVTTTVANCLAFYALSFDGGDSGTMSVAGAGWTETDDLAYGTANAGVSGSWGTKSMATAGATGTASVTCQQTDGASYFQLAIQPLVPSPSLEHRWRTQNVPAGADIMKFYVTGMTSAGADDTFTFGYSTVLGGPYTPTSLTVSSSTMTTYNAVVPTSLTGQFYINVIDDNGADSVQDTLYIDAISIYWQQITGLTTSTQIATADNPVDGTVVGTYALTNPPANAPPDTNSQQFTEVDSSSMPSDPIDLMSTEPGPSPTALIYGPYDMTGPAIPAGWTQFGTGANSWVAIDCSDNGLPVPTLGDDAVMWCNWDANAEDRSLQTQAMDFSAYHNVVMTFEHFMSGTWGDQLYLDYSLNGGGAGGTWVTITSWLADGSSANWNVRSNIDCSAVDFQPNVCFRFRYVQTDGNSNGVDYVTINADMAGTTLEHTWTMNNLPDNALARNVYATARYSAGSDDNFQFGWSQNVGGPFTPITGMTVSSASYATYTGTIPVDFSGPLFINIIDTNTADSTYSTLYVDSLYVESTISPVNTSVNVLWDLSADDGAGQNDVVQYNVYYSDAEFGGNEMGTYNYLGSVPAGTGIYRHYGENEDMVNNIWYIVTAQDAYSEGFSTMRATKFNVAPEAQNVMVDSATFVEVTAGTSVTLSANIFDDSSTWEDILKLDGAEWYADTDPGEGLGTPMTGDGLWDSTFEPCTATIDTTGWTVGSHQIFVRGHEYGPGNTGTGWGAVSGVVLINITGGPTPYTIDLTGHVVGEWVFVSFPVEVTGNIEIVLNDATLGDGFTTWDVAKWCSAQDVMDPWKTYRFGSTVNDLSTITNQMGVWLHLTANGGDAMLTLGAIGNYPAAAVVINLYTGWNMVGYPSATSQLASATLPGAADYISVWQAASPYVTDYSDLGLVTMSHGNAYWVHVTADCTWTVNP